MPQLLPRSGLLTTLLASLLCTTTAFAEVQAQDGYVRAVPPGHSISAAYLTLRNNSTSAVQLDSARTDSAGTTELHQSRQQDGVMRMRAAQQVEIPAGAEYRLQPGGDHLMLIDLKQPLNAGDEVRLQLNFSDGQQLQLTLPVRSPMDAMDEATARENPHSPSHSHGTNATQQHSH
ncbi:copper chaperone PCu(A)C [Marinobacterium sedimentorum]|uniref:copper chaperone PCu(A)C n=1 Tax=Marinobacterium sedimentorum TaxID=2927804 RepID=UPI0020C62FEF|nr:copper chaperone PCu(A)C [Marinobacterium sedimentorum]MCP8689916.1 copper chaperone PCu(A)C [Marinobacterium sedimentorum]